MPGTNSLGEYLRARRSRLTPFEVGLPAGNRRRVSGLRREEVALLAGISPEYYVRLEQGRHNNPSVQVLGGLADALKLDHEAASHLFSLAGVTSQRTTRSLNPEGNDAIESLIAGWSTTAAYVMGRDLTIIASNHLAVALSPHFAVGDNALTAAFTQPDMRDLYRDWEAITERVVAYLRAGIVDEHHQRSLAPLISELLEVSPRFRDLWARHEVRRKSSGITELSHPVVGDIDLYYLMMELPDTGHVLVTYHAERGSLSESALLALHDNV